MTAGAGVTLVFASPVGRSSYDVGMVDMSKNGGSISAPMWLQDTPSIDEQSPPHVADYGGDLLVTWRPSESSTEVARVSENGAILEPIASTNATTQASMSPVNFENGDVGWAFAVDQAPSFTVVRVPVCEM